MCGWQLCHGQIRSSFVGHQTVLCCLLSVVASGKFCQVPVVVTLPIENKNKQKKKTPMKNQLSQVYSEIIIQWLRFDDIHAATC